jgi:uncharacterized protein YdeI (YjbR/CyaY-like superfamily)
VAALKRPTQPMPEDVEAALAERGLTKAFAARPDYQRNDYLAWIGRSTKEATRTKRLEQMLTELADGNRYMNMYWRPKQQR